MKKIRLSSVFLLLLLMTANLLSLSSAAIDENDDLDVIIYTDFEADGFEGWYNFGNKSKITLTDEKSYSGKYCIVTSDRTKAWSGPSLNITDNVRPGSEILIKAYVMSESEQGSTIKLSLKSTDSKGEDIYSSIDTVEAENDNWSIIQGEYTVPGDLSDLCVYFETETDLNDFCVDGITIYGQNKKASDMDVNPGEFAFGFEDDLNGWIQRGECSVSVIDKFSYEGHYSLYIADRQETWCSSSVRLGGIITNADYYYSAYVMYNDKNYPDNYYFTINLQYALNGEEVYDIIAAKELQNGTWSKISGHYKLPADATNVHFYVQSVSGPDESPSILPFYVDKVTIIDGSVLKAKARIHKIIVVSSISVVSVAILLIIIGSIHKSKKTNAAIRSARIDAMTGALNRNAFENDIAELELSIDKVKKIHITMCDLNYLKNINDNYGHEFGDKAIIRCASVLLKSVDRHGKVYRTGGDEFLCITESDRSKTIHDEILIEMAKYKGYPFSAASGSAHYDKSIDGNKPSIKTIIARADKEMYKNKENIKKNYPIT